MSSAISPLDEDKEELDEFDPHNGDKIREILAKIGNACKVGSMVSLTNAYSELRREILLVGVSDEKESNSMTHPRNSIRGLVWKVLMGLDRDAISAKTYKLLISLGKCKNYDKVRSDSFRTFPSEEVFQSIVSEESIIRVLNSYVHAYQHLDCKYLQGMNALAGVFLYTMPELDAFYCLSRMITKYCPMYWVPDIYGPKAACILVNDILRIVDPDVEEALRKHNYSAEIYAFPLVSTFCACVPTFSELLKLWDFLFAFGLHLNLICVAAQVVMIRDVLLAKGARPFQHLSVRDWPPLNAEAIIRKTISILHLIPANIMNKVFLHMTDPNVCSELLQADLPRLKLIEQQANLDGAEIMSKKQ